MTSSGVSAHQSLGSRRKLQPRRQPDRPQALSPRSAAHAALRGYWDDDAATYDLWREHGAHSAAERAAWRGELSRYLPPCGARVLDVGAGTGFLSRAAASLGYLVTALDISPEMLARLEASAGREGLTIDTVCASAESPPPGPYDAIIERLALWTLPDPVAALQAWMRVTVPGGRLLVFEGLWAGGSYGEALRRRARGLLHRLQTATREHHARYSSELAASLPLLADPSPNRIIETIEVAGWRNARLARLSDVEFARTAVQPPLGQSLGATPEYLVHADADPHLAD